MLDTLKDIGPGDIVMGESFQFKVYKLDSKTRAKIFYKAYLHDGKVYYDDWSGHKHRERAFMAEVLVAKTVPTTWTGPASSKDCGYVRLTRFINGDQKAYQAWVASGRRPASSNGTHDIQTFTVASDPDKPKSLVNTKRYKKLDLICAVLMAHGPLHKDDVLRRVAVLEGKPWVKGSNSDYFTIAQQHMGCIEPCGKNGAKVTHWLTHAGVIRGSQVLADVGIDLVKNLP